MRLVSRADKKNSYAVIFLRLLCLGGQTHRKKQSAKSDAKEFAFCTIAYCLAARACFHLITLSARKRTDSGIVRLRAFAVFRLITSSNFVGLSTGKSAGLAPLRILST